MEKPRKTTFGQYYAVRSTGPITITQTNEAGTFTVVKVEAADGTGTGEVGFTSIAARCTIVTEEGCLYAITPTFSRGGAAAQGAAVQITIDQDYQPTSTNPQSGTAVAQAIGTVSGGGGSGDGLHDSVGLSSAVAGKGAAAYCAYSLAVGEGAVVGAKYSTNDPTAVAERVSDKEESTTSLSWNYCSYSTAYGFHAAAYGKNSMALGAFAKAGNESSTASGYNATASGYNATASGYNATASGAYATASGYNATASGAGATAPVSFATSYGCKAIGQGEGGFTLGALGVNADPGNGVFTVMSDIPAELSEGDYWSMYFDPGSGAWYGLPSSTVITQFYLIGGGTAQAELYTGGQAGLGFVEMKPDGTILRRGCRKLADLLTDHTTDFSPTLQFETKC